MLRFVECLRQLKAKYKSLPVNKKKVEKVFANVKEEGRKIFLKRKAKKFYVHMAFQFLKVF